MKMLVAGATEAWAGAHFEVLEVHAVVDRVKRLRAIFSFPAAIPAPFFRTSQILARSA